MKRLSAVPANPGAWALACAVVLCALLGPSTGCALTSKGKPMSTRYFSPELTTPSDAPAIVMSTSAAEPLELRLGAVEAASHLEERMAYRLDDSELGYYDERRWSERPEEYVRRALEVELFERRRVRRILSGRGTTLDVQVLSFEELRTPTPRVRVALRFTLHDERKALLEKSLAIEEPLAPGSTEDGARRVAAAMAVALRRVVTQTSELVTNELKPRAAAPITATGTTLKGDGPP